MTTTTINLPTFGLVRIELLPGGTLVACLGQNDISTLDDPAANDVRQLAQDALAAAEWLEMQA